LAEAIGIRNRPEKDEVGMAAAVLIPHFTEMRAW